MTDAIFVLEGERFRPTDKARSPWGETLLHGGSAAGLLARAVERFNEDPGLQASRLTVDLLRPVPNRPLDVHVETVRRGGRIHVVEASLLADGELVTRATALLLRPLDEPLAMPAPSLPFDGPELLEPRTLGDWMGSRSPNFQPPAGRAEGLHTTIEVRWVNRGEDGPNRAWVRLPAQLVAGEANTPFVLAATLSDFTNAFANSGPRLPVGMINADITLYLHRYPAGEWIALETQRRAEPSGLAVSTATMYDEDGPIGTAVESALVNQRNLTPGPPLR
ncbi:MAG TPA: thioesterase family protein [Dehalococcoidia bacterium]